MAAKGPPWIVHIDKMDKYGHTRSILEFNSLSIGSDRLMAYAWLTDKTSCFVKNLRHPEYRIIFNLYTDVLGSNYDTIEIDLIPVLKGALNLGCKTVCFLNIR